MNEPLPSGWTVATFGEVLPIQYGKGLTKHSRNSDGTVPVVGSSGVVGSHEAALTPGPALVIGRKGNVGSVHLSPVPCWPIDTVYFASGTSSTNLAYFKYLLSFLDLRHLDRSTAVPGLSRDDYNVVNAVIAPLPEQHRIVEAIESYFTRLDDAVATLERVQRNLKRYRASVLHAAVEGRLVPTEAELARAEGRDYEPASVLLDRILAERRRRWQEAGGRGKYEEPVAPDIGELPELPEGWCWTTLPQLGELNRGKSRHRPRDDPRLLGGSYPFIQTSDVRKADGFITTHEATYSEFGLAQSRLWPAGTLCITIAANIAETGILWFDACFPDSVVGFLQGDPLLTRYVEFFIWTARAKLSQYAPATAQKNINLQVLSEVAVPLPPAAEQGRIVAEADRHLSVAGQCGQVASQDVARCARLRQAILKWAFEGKLADQDPNDEPAAVLLQRIKADREQLAPDGRSRGVRVTEEGAPRRVSGRRGIR